MILPLHCQLQIIICLVKFEKITKSGLCDVFEICPGNFNCFPMSTLNCQSLAVESQFSFVFAFERSFSPDLMNSMC